MYKSKSNLEISSSFSFSKTAENKGPNYRATKLWNRAVKIFLGIPLSKNRKSNLLFWKEEENSFLGADAVAWFHQQLKQEFNQNITKQQTFDLLQKFYSANVFLLCNNSGDNLNFKENQIYRFPSKNQPQSLAVSTQKYSVEIIPLSKISIENIWKQCFLECLSSVSDVHPPLIRLTHLYSNITSVCVSAPSWLLSAMNSLIDWPLSKSEYYHYENFELDVYKLILEYYKSYFIKHGTLLSNNQLFIKYYNNQCSRSVSTERLIMDILTPTTMRNNSEESLNVYWETAFYQKSPITRVLSTEFKSSLHSLKPCANLFAFENPGLTLSPHDIINHPKYTSVKQGLDSAGTVQGLDNSNATRSHSHHDYLYDSEWQQEDKLLECYRLLMLLLEPEKRRNLQLLLRFISKVGTNGNIQLNSNKNNQEILLLSCSGWIIDDVRVVKFLVKNQSTIFNGGILEQLKEKANNIIKQLQIKKVIVPDKENINYCSKISMVEFEDQRLLGTTARELRELLDLINNNKQNEKERKKRLKQFEKEYPHIYQEKFGKQTSPTTTTIKRTPFGVLI